MSTVDVRSRQYHTLNPATGELIAEYDFLSADEAERRLASGHAAQQQWARTPVEERVRVYRDFADVFERSIEDFARQVTLEMGKPLTQSRGEAGIVPVLFRYYAEHGPQMLADVRSTTQGGALQTVTRREPLGVVLAIEPWNAPLYQAMRVAAPNLFLGNGVLLKPAEICAGSTLMFDELFAQAGFPEHLFQTVLVSLDQVSTYIADPRVRGVALTGSDRAGAAVGEQAGKQIKPVVLELGGSDAFIVLESADVAAAAGCAAEWRLALGGQICVSPKRVILVGDKVADEFIPAYTAVFESAVVGDGFDPTTTVGPLSSPTAAAELQAQYEDAIAKGAEVLVAGGRVDPDGAFFKPAVLAEIPPDARIFTEEAFGPLGMIYKVATTEEAIELANSSSYGLGACVFGAPDEALEVGGRLDTGVTGINTFCGLGGPDVPYGGTKRSGFGRELGPTSMDAFSNLRSYLIA